MAGGDGPATALFRNFEALSAAATRHHYEHDLGIGLEAVALIDTEEAMRHSSTRDQQREAFQAFFGGSASPRRLLVIPESVLEWRDRSASRRLGRGSAQDDRAHGPCCGAGRRVRRLSKTSAMRCSPPRSCSQRGSISWKAEEFELPDGTPEGSEGGSAA